MEMKARRLSGAAMLAAMVFVVTWAVRMPLPQLVGGGYVNLGDTVIYLGTWLLGAPGIAAAALGSALADLAAGAVVYALPTAMIKGAMAFVVFSLRKTRAMKWFLFGATLAGAVMVAGYAVFELLTFGATYALVAFPFNAVQWIGGVAVSMALAPAAERIRTYCARGQA